MLAMIFSGRRGLRLGAFPSRMTVSAYFPGSMDPMESCIPTALAPLMVAKSKSSCAVATVGSHLLDFWRSPRIFISANMSRVLLVVFPSVPMDTLTPYFWNSGTGATPPVASFMLDTGHDERSEEHTSELQSPD